MTLFEYILSTPEDEEITVWDSVYDMETYFYNQENDAWDKAMLDLAKKLNVVEITSNGVTVDLYDLISRNIDNIRDSALFYDPDLDVDEVMDDMENILAGNVSEFWFEAFVSCLT